MFGPGRALAGSGDLPKVTTARCSAGTIEDRLGQQDHSARTAAGCDQRLERGSRPPLPAAH